MVRRAILIIKSIFYPPWNSPRSKSTLNILTTFSSFKPHGNQPYKTFEPLVIKNINELLPKLSKLAQLKKQIDIKTYETFYERNKKSNSEDIAKLLGNKFNYYGSDKEKNQYHIIYSCLLNDLHEKYEIFEIGLGTNNSKIISSMGENGKPGASLRAFRDVYSQSTIFGADYDKEILFSEDRIKTVYIDQNNPNTFENIKKITLNKFDLIIDDGLHYQLSNINTLLFSLENLKLNGYLIIEDIGIWTLDTWKIVINLVPENFTAEIIEMSQTNFVFLIKRIS